MHAVFIGRGGARIEGESRAPLYNLFVGVPTCSDVVLTVKAGSMVDLSSVV